ncbi:MAG: deoxyribonuclease V [Bdellovibrionota bacterium]
MRLQELHAWDLPVPEARKVQERLAGLIQEKPLPKEPRLIAGTDVSYDAKRDRFVAGVVVLKFPELETVEEQIHVGKTSFPYVPGFLSFREIPALAGALEKVRSKVDLLVCDGQGRSHPRRLGLASHLGLLVQIPTIGCAKSRLVGEHKEPGKKRGSNVPLTHQGEIIGRVLRTRDGVAPLYVSVGHLVTLEESVRWVLALSKTRIPEPTKRADHLVGKEMRARSG